MGRVTPKSETIDRLLSSVYPAMAVLAGMRLDIFSTISKGAHTVEEIAQALDVGETRLGSLLYALAAIGLLKVADGYFVNSEEANHYLVAGKPDYRGDGYVMSQLWHAVLGTEHSIRSGKPYARHDYASMSRAELEHYMRNFLVAGLRDGHSFARMFDFSDCQALLDAGGGVGPIALAMTEAWSHMRATVVDLPSVAPIARTVIAEADAISRVDVIAHDLVAQPLPASYTGVFDAAVMKSFVQVLGPADARSAIRNVSQTLKPGGNLYILGNVVDNSRLEPYTTVIANLRFINIYDEGQAYTEQEHRDWLEAAGIGDIRMMSFKEPMSIVFGRKRG